MMTERLGYSMMRDAQPRGGSLARDIQSAFRIMDAGLACKVCCFQDSLPEISSVQPAHRPSVLASHRRRVRNDMIADLMAACNHRLWIRGHGAQNPDFHRRSCCISHKGTIVAIAHADTIERPFLGIDVENGFDAFDVPWEEISPEGLPPGIGTEEGTLLAFSAKESIFKALSGHPGQPVGFNEAALDWVRDVQGTWWARTDLGVDLVVAGRQVADGWVATVAGTPTRTFTHPPEF